MIPSMCLAILYHALAMVWNVTYNPEATMAYDNAELSFPQGFTFW